MVLCWDLETDRFAPSNLAPEPICLSLADDSGAELVIASCEPEFDDVVEHCLKSDLQCNTNIAFDMTVIACHRPKLAPLIWDAYNQDRVTCLIVRDKLKFLADTGNLQVLYAQNGAKQKLQFSQKDMEVRHLGIDRSAAKDEEDSWRNHFIHLKGRPASEYPEEARQYSQEDSRYGLRIYHEQGGPITPEFLSTRAALALYLSTCWGFPVDPDMVERLLVEMSAKFADNNFPHLLTAEILRPAVPARPYKRSIAKAVEIVGKEPLNWEPYLEQLKAAEIPVKEAEPSSINEKALRAKFKEVHERTGIPVRMTDPSPTHPDGQISFGEEAQADLEGLDEHIDEYIARQKVAKLVTTELPRMRAGRVHPKYDVIKKTGRTSSFGNRKTDKNPAYPAVNIQQIDPRVREAYIASPGHVLCSVDYNFIELVSAAQKCLTLFDQSVLADKINAGMDPHAYLAAAICRALNPEFPGHDDGDTCYRMFMELEKTQPKVWKHWRNLAKPTGLGFPGGLGAAKFIGYAKSTFKIDIIKIAGGWDQAVELSKKLKDLWKRTFPEMDAYFKWITSECPDLEWSVPGDERYCYVSPLGMVRRNCYYTEATNGAALQTPTAEGAKIALWRLAQACYDARVGSCLLGCHLLAFIHDEVIVEIPHDELMHERAHEVARIMREGMEQVMTRVKVGAGPTLMFRWNKDAKAVYDQNQRLQVWMPPTTTAA